MAIAFAVRSHCRQCSLRRQGAVLLHLPVIEAGLVFHSFHPLVSALLPTCHLQTSVGEGGVRVATSGPRRSACVYQARVRQSWADHESELGGRGGGRRDGCVAWAGRRKGGGTLREDPRKLRAKEGWGARQPQEAAAEDAGGGARLGKREQGWLVDGAMGVRPEGGWASGTSFGALPVSEEEEGEWGRMGQAGKHGGERAGRVKREEAKERREEGQWAERGLTRNEDAEERDKYNWRQQNLGVDDDEEDENEEEEEVEEEEEEEEEEEDEGDEGELRVEVWEGDLPAPSAEEEEELLREAAQELAELEAARRQGRGEGGFMVGAQWGEPEGRPESDGGEGSCVEDLERQVLDLQQHLAEAQAKLQEARQSASVKTIERKQEVNTAQGANQSLDDTSSGTPHTAKDAGHPEVAPHESIRGCVSASAAAKPASVPPASSPSLDQPSGPATLRHALRSQRSRERLEAADWGEGTEDGEEWGGGEAWQGDAEEWELGAPAGRGREGRGLPAVMRCFDTAKIFVKAGDGGNGVVAFRREKFVPNGGPSGGNGGRGGNVYVEADAGMTSLLPFRSSVHFRAGRGAHGQGSRRHGEVGRDVVIKVPLGTIIRAAEPRSASEGGEADEWAEGAALPSAAESPEGVGGGAGAGRVLVELVEAGQRELLLAGGRGGRGNAAFKTHRSNAPQLAENGEEGPAQWVQLELQLVADVGIVGAPNAGKSTLLAAISAAQPKVAPYPFTTLVPNLGVVRVRDFSSIVFADVPGLLEGAAQGVGLGHEFLRHTLRCAVLVHVVDGSSPSCLADYQAVTAELLAFHPAMAAKPRLVVFNKTDVPQAWEQWPAFERSVAAAEAERAGVQGSTQAGEPGMGDAQPPTVMCMSAATGEGTQEVVEAAWRLLKVVEEQKGDEQVHRRHSWDREAWEAQEQRETRLKARHQSVGVQLQRAQNERLGAFSVAADRHTRTFFVRGAGVQRFVQMTNWEFFESVQRFARVLEACGINDALKAEGAREGDTVVIGKMEFTWRDSDDVLAALGSDWERGNRGSKLWPH